MGYPCKEYYNPITSKIEMTFYCVLTSLVIIPGVIENIVVIYTIISKPRLHTPAYCLNAALATSDLLIAMVGGTFYVLIIALGGSGNCLLKTGFVFVHATLSITTSLLLAVITRDRYLAFKNSPSMTQHATVKKNILLALVCFLVSISLALAVFIELEYSVFSARELYSAVFFTAFIVIAIYYQNLRKLVKEHTKAQLARETTGLSFVEPDSKWQRSRRSKKFASVNASIIMLVGSYAFAYFPFAILFVMHTINQRIFNKLDTGVSHAFVWANTFGYLNAVIDPLIYAFRCDPIGKELRRVFYRVKGRLYHSQVGLESQTF